MVRPHLFRSPPTNLDRRKVLSLLIIPSYLVIIAVLFPLDGTVAFAQPLFLLLLNSVFLGLTPCTSRMSQSYRFGRAASPAS